MASNWTANLDSATFDGGNVVAVITFTHAVTGEKIVEKLRADDLTDARVAEFAYVKIRSLDSRDVSKTTLRIGPITPKAPVVRVI